MLKHTWSDLLEPVMYDEGLNHTCIQKVSDNYRATCWQQEMTYFLHVSVLYTLPGVLVFRS